MFIFALFGFLGFVVVGGVAFGIYHYVTEAKDSNKEWKNREYTTLSRWLLLLNVTITFVAIVLFICGFIYSNGILAVVGLLVWLVSSVVSALSCSPLKIFVVSNSYNGQGCIYFLWLPLLYVVSLVQVILTMFISWIFAVLAIFRRSKIGFRIVAILIIVGMLAAAFSVLWFLVFAKDAEPFYIRTARKSCVEKVETLIGSGNAEKLSYTPEELSALQDIGYNSGFDFIESREILANQLSKEFLDEDIDGIFDIFRLLVLNGEEGLMDEEAEACICLTDEYMDFIKKTVREKGTLQSRPFVFKYGDAIIDCGLSFKFDIEIEGKEFIVCDESTLKGDIVYEKHPHDGYYIVGETVTFKIP